MNRLLLVVTGTIASSLAFSGTMGPITKLSPVYAELMSGYAFPFHEKLLINYPNNTSRAAVQLNGSVFFAGELGYRFTPHIRSGVEVAYRPDYKMTSYDPTLPYGQRKLGFSPANAFTALVNAYLAANPYYHLTPYITGGIGAAVTRLGDINVHHEVTNVPVFYQPRGRNTRFTWQAGAGVSYEWNPSVSFDLRGRFVDFDRSISNDSIPGVSQHSTAIPGVYQSAAGTPGDHNVFKYKTFELGFGITVAL